MLKSTEIKCRLLFKKITVTVEGGLIKSKLLKHKTALVPAVSTRYLCQDLDVHDDGIFTMPEDTQLAIIDSHGHFQICNIYTLNKLI